MALKTQSGWLCMGKRDREAIETVLKHCIRDMEYEAGGTFGDGDKVYSKEIEKAKLGISHIDWILKTYLD